MLIAFSPNIQQGLFCVILFCLSPKPQLAFSKFSAKAEITQNRFLSHFCLFFSFTFCRPLSIGVTKCGECIV